MPNVVRSIRDEGKLSPMLEIKDKGDDKSDNLVEEPHRQKYGADETCEKKGDNNFQSCPYRKGDRLQDPCQLVHSDEL